MYYIIETAYAGPNPGEHLNHDTFDISSVPAQTNMAHEVRTSGWCGTTGDWAVYAHGAYETVEAAEGFEGGTLDEYLEWLESDLQRLIVEPNEEETEQ